MDTPTSYLTRIRACCPELSLASVRMNHDGLMNDVVIVNDQHVFRFPKDDHATHAMRQESQILALARQYIALRLPDFRQVAEDCVAYDYLPGDGVSCDDLRRLDTATQDRLACQLATFLRQLHTIPRPVLRHHHIPRSPAGRTREGWLQLFQAVEHELFPLLSSARQHAITQRFAPVRDGRLSLQYDPVLIHGDLLPYHVLYDRHTQCFTGVIDFGTAG